jgi:hypothetical protein
MIFMKRLRLESCPTVNLSTVDYQVLTTHLVTARTYKLLNLARLGPVYILVIQGGQGNE